MGMIKRTSTDAVKDSGGHEAKAAELEAKAAEATTTIDRMEAEAVDAIVDDPRQAEKIGAGITAQQRMARAFTAKADQHRTKAAELKREALELEAAELHREADKLDKEADRHAAQVDELLVKLLELDGLEYGPLERVKKDGDWKVQNAGASVTAKFRHDIEAVRIKADNNRYYLATGRPAKDKQDLNAELGSAYNVMIMPMQLQAYHTTALLAQIASGNVTADVEA